MDNKRYVEDTQANKQINKIAALVSKGMPDGQIADLFDGKVTNKKRGNTTWRPEDILDIRTGFSFGVSDKPESNQVKRANKKSARLTECKTCGAEISKNARVCPQCGQRKTTPTTYGCLTIIVITVILSIAAQLGNNESQEEQANQDSASETRIQDDGKQPRRLAFIKKLLSTGFYLKIETPATLPHAYVGPAFWLANITEKESMLDATLSYYIINDPRANILILKDGQTGKGIGTFSEYGLDLD